MSVFGVFAKAHEMRPSIATVTVLEEGRVELRLELNAEAWLAEIPPSVTNTDDALNAPVYDALRQLDDETLAAELVARQRALIETLGLFTERSKLPLSLQGVQVFPEPDLGLPRISEVSLIGGLTTEAQGLRYEVDPTHPATAVRVYLSATEDPIVDYLMTGQSTPLLPLVGPILRDVPALVGRYITLGFLHILPKGLDHIVFILGLVLLSHRLMDLVWQVTAFTVAHSVTLALGLFGVITLSPAIVEPLIAASIAYVAFENLYRSHLVRSRTAIVFLFGLLHGLGFASVLTELGLPPRDYVIGLLAFNGGVELGQFAVIAGAYLSVGYWVLKAPWYRSRVAVPASLAIGGLGTFWCLERLGVFA
ncbi:MAG: HupE/UreJ family protein [Gammaproteobacteria bacterium]|nr:HupE/UreJ family protein [Gammaproteobacteria bacterium]